MSGAAQVCEVLEELCRFVQSCACAQVATADYAEKVYKAARRGSISFAARSARSVVLSEASTALQQRRNAGMAGLPLTATNQLVAVVSLDASLSMAQHLRRLCKVAEMRIQLRSTCELASWGVEEPTGGRRPNIHLRDGFWEGPQSTMAP